MSKDSEEIRKHINNLDNIINESSLSRIWKHIEEDSSFGTLSPFRKDLTVKENEERYKELKNIIRSLGYGYIELEGGFNEEGTMVKEKSLFIPKIKKEELIKLGERYNQYSVIYKDEKEFIEIGTNDKSGIGKILNDFISKGWNKNLSFDSDLTKEIFSSLIKGSHKDKKFLYNLKELYLFEIEPLSFNEIAYGKKKYGTDNRKIRLL